jgi:hypothetical protein
MNENGRLESQNKRQSERHVKDKSSSKKDEETANGESKPSYQTDSYQCRELKFQHQIKTLKIRKS